MNKSCIGEESETDSAKEEITSRAGTRYDGILIVTGSFLTSYRVTRLVSIFLGLLDAEEVPLSGFGNCSPKGRGSHQFSM